MGHIDELAVWKKFAKKCFHFLYSLIEEGTHSSGEPKEFFVGNFRANPSRKAVARKHQLTECIHQ